MRFGIDRPNGIRRGVAGSRLPGFLLSVAVLSALVTSPLPAAEPLTLRQALSAAAERANIEEARIGLAYGQLHLLESQRKFKIELRPHLGMLAFSNPALLAANIGTGLLAHRFRRPDNQAMRSAQFDILASEIARERSHLDTQVETAAAFFALLERQEAADRAARLWERRGEQREHMVDLLAASRVTVRDQSLFEAGLADLEAELIDAEARRKAAAIQLARLIGRAGQPSDLRVAGGGMSTEWRNASLEAEGHIELAIARRGELRLLREKLEQIPRGPAADPRFRLETAGAGYSYITDSVGSRLGVNPEGFVLGGNTVRPDVGFAVNLRDTGEKAATREINAARRHVLELELEAAEESVRAEVETVWHMAEASRRKLSVAARRQRVLRDMLASMKVRVEHGLASPNSLLEAEMEVLRQDGAYEHAVNVNRTREFHLMAVCGDAGETLSALNTNSGGPYGNDD